MRARPSLSLLSRLFFLNFVALIRRFIEHADITSAKEREREMELYKYIYIYIEFSHTRVCVCVCVCV